jgi:hypothetical protein
VPGYRDSNDSGRPPAELTMKRSFLLTLAVAVSLASFSPGCQPRRSAAGRTGQAPPYTGPTQPMAEVVAEINANNSALPELWARHYFEANIVDDRGRATFANGDGVLLYKAPLGMRFVGEKPGVGRIFTIGSTEERYWLTLSPPNDASRMWWGWYRNLGKPCVDMRAVPVRPDQVLQVLGVSTIPTNFIEPPAPVMRFNNDADSYMFVWQVPAGDRWAAQKEIWYDRQTKLPRRVFLFDEHGRVVLRAKLSQHTPVEVPDVPRERWPRVARRYELYFPDTGSTMEFELDEVLPGKRGTRIAFPERENVSETIQLDKDCVD